MNIHCGHHSQHTSIAISTTGPTRALHLQYGYTVKQKLPRRTQHNESYRPTKQHRDRAIYLETDACPFPSISARRHRSSALHDISVHLSSASPLERPTAYRAHLLLASVTRSTPRRMSYATNAVLGPCSPPHLTLPHIQGCHPEKWLTFTKPMPPPAPNSAPCSGPTTHIHGCHPCSAL